MSIWTGELSVGNKVIDTEHKKLHNMIYGSICLAAARGATALAEMLDELENRLCAYFAVEERIAQAVNFDFGQHRLAHQQLLNEVRRIKNEVAASNCACPDNKDYVRCLMNSLTRHIKEDGKPLKIVLETHLYDFNP